jgi:hypothetical protein
VNPVGIRLKYRIIKYSKTYEVKSIIIAKIAGKKLQKYAHVGKALILKSGENVSLLRREEILSVRTVVIAISTNFMTETKRRNLYEYTRLV